MRTIYLYEASDINLKNELHALLVISISLAALTFSNKNLGRDAAINQGVADFLNTLSSAGYEIKKVEK